MDEKRIRISAETAPINELRGAVVGLYRDLISLAKENQLIYDKNLQSLEKQVSLLQRRNELERDLIPNGGRTLNPNGGNFNQPLSLDSNLFNPILERQDSSLNLLRSIDSSLRTFLSQNNGTSGDGNSGDGGGALPTGKGGSGGLAGLLKGGLAAFTVGDVVRSAVGGWQGYNFGKAFADYRGGGNGTYPVLGAISGMAENSEILGMLGKMTGLGDVAGKLKFSNLAKSQFSPYAFGRDLAELTYGGIGGELYDRSLSTLNEMAGVRRGMAQLTGSNHFNFPIQVADFDNLSLNGAYMGMSPQQYWQRQAELLRQSGGTSYMSDNEDIMRMQHITGLSNNTTASLQYAQRFSTSGGNAADIVGVIEGSLRQSGKPLEQIRATLDEYLSVYNETSARQIELLGKVDTDRLSHALTAIAVNSGESGARLQVYQRAFTGQTMNEGDTATALMLRKIRQNNPNMGYADAMATLEDVRSGARPDLMREIIKDMTSSGNRNVAISNMRNMLGLTWRQATDAWDKSGGNPAQWLEENGILRGRDYSKQEAESVTGQGEILNAVDANKFLDWSQSFGKQLLDNTEAMSKAIDTLLKSIEAGELTVNKSLKPNAGSFPNTAASGAWTVTYLLTQILGAINSKKGTL